MTAPTAMLLWAPDPEAAATLRLIAHNPAGRALLPEAPAPTIGETARELFAAMTAPDLGQLLERVRRSRDPVDIERMRVPKHPERVYSARLFSLPGEYVALTAEDITDRARVEETRAADLRILELIATGAALPEVLAALVTACEELAPGMMGSILLVENGTVRHGAAPRLPREYIRAIDGQPIGHNRGSCGTAAALGEPVIASDIATDPRWASFKQLALECGLAACWSVPIFGPSRAVFGTFAFYYRAPTSPTPELLELIHHASRLAAIAIARWREQTALAESEASSRAIIDHALDANIIMRADGVITRWSAQAAHIFGWRADEAIGRTVADLIVPPERQAAHRAALQRYQSTGQSVLLNRRVQVMALRRDGGEFPVELAITPIQLADGLAFSAFLSDISERKRADELLREAQQHLSLVYDHVDDVLFHLLVEAKGRYRFASANPAFYRSTGLMAKQVVGKLLDEVIPEPALSQVLEHYREAIESQHTVRWTERTQYPSGERVGDVAVTPVFDEHGAPKYLIGSVRDVTESRRMEDEMRQLQRLEALGKLTGGVAHDFNNILAVICGYAESVQQHLRAGDPLCHDIDEIAKAAKRATSLTRQLLAFGRKQTLQPRVLDLNRVLKELKAMLARLIREDIELSFALAEELWRVAADPGQLEQVIVNLVVNARDAMPNGGKMLIETGNIDLREDHVRTHPEIAPGQYVLVAVTDTGCGMDEQTKRRIFEPFFTTKADKGTGLGLATVYGIVRQSGGHIWVYSEPNVGTTFKLYLPLTDLDAAAESPDVAPPQARAGHERVLLVEDEPALREMCMRMLKAMRYSVLACANAGEALLAIEQRGYEPHILITDLIMPGMSGNTLAERLSVRLPQLRVLYMSGYTDNTITHHGVLAPGTMFLQKPFTRRELEAKVQLVLDSAQSA